MDPHNVIERGLRVYERLLVSEPGLVAELEQSRATFFGTAAPPAADDLGAVRRHLEWFLFERVSGQLDGIPVERLTDRWLDEADGELRELVACFPLSVAGIYEVTGSEPGQGIWLVDLLGRGEYPVRELELTEEFAPGDLIVGRLFPLGDLAAGAFQLSPAAVTFRNPELRDALRRDMDTLRGSRRGVLRIEQSELERMFWSVAPAKDDEAAREEAFEAALAALLAGGVEPDAAEAWLEGIRASENPGQAVGELLEDLAFETEVDLERARQALLLLGSQPETGTMIPQPPPAEAASAQAPSAEADATARGALEAFDRARAAGGDLEEAFNQLERDLGLDAPAEAAEDDGAPDFPGVVGAMVVEFVWDTERVGRDLSEEARRALGWFAQFATDVGAFEDLGVQELGGFAAVRIFDEPEFAELRQPGEAFDALAAFARWTFDEHDMPLWKVYEPIHQTLEEHAERVRGVNVALAGSGRDDDRGQLYEVLETDNVHALRLRSMTGKEADARTRADLADVRPGDWLRAERSGTTEEPELELLRVYPPAARAVLSQINA